MKNSLDFISTRKGFNVALRHFKLVNGFISQMSKKNNPADLINDAYDQKKIDQFQYSAALNVLLIDKFNYFSSSFNLKHNVENLSSMHEKFSQIKVFDVVLSYFHPQLGQVIINPKNPESWSSIDSLKENELVVVYIGDYDNSFDRPLAKDCFDAIVETLNGGKALFKKFIGSNSTESTPKPSISPAKVQPVQDINKSTEQKTEKTPDKQEATGKKKLSTQYGVLVSNELFHNGNVEAWKRIITSYESKYPSTKVLVFYDGEQIQDLNTLFKWGKVKHGTNIYFRLMGVEHSDVSKLRRYLSQGASNRFEDFLKGDPTKMLKLF